MRKGAGKIILKYLEIVGLQAVKFVYNGVTPKGKGQPKMSNRSKEMNSKYKFFFFWNKTTGETKIYRKYGFAEGAVMKAKGKDYRYELSAATEDWALNGWEETILEVG